MKEGDVGTVITFTIKDKDDSSVVNLTGFDTATVIMNLDGTRRTGTAAFGTRVSGIVTYTIASGDLHKGGRLEMEAKVAKADGSESYTSDVISEDVQPLL